MIFKKLNNWLNKTFFEYRHIHDDFVFDANKLSKIQTSKNVNTKTTITTSIADSVTTSCDGGC